VDLIIQEVGLSIIAQWKTNTLLVKLHITLLYSTELYHTVPKPIKKIKREIQSGAIHTMMQHVNTYIDHPPVFHQERILFINKQ
jgi:hypothetical protein